MIKQNKPAAVFYRKYKRAPLLTTAGAFHYLTTGK
jgi:hypothetical protein